MLDFLGFIALGLFVGTVGTLLGAGGAFLLVPSLLLLFPQASPAFVTGISLAVVFFNAGSGSFAYARMGRVDFRSGAMFAAATIPGAVLGAITTTILPRRAFDIIFGVLLAAVSAYLFWRPLRADAGTGPHHGPGRFVRRVVEKDGTVHEFSYNPWVGVGFSAGVGYLNGLLGIGGGIIHVPVLVQILGFPVHIATATSHFTLAIMSLAATLVHLVNGQLASSAWVIAPLAIGVLVGAQAGARLSNRVHGVWIMRGLAAGLGFVGLRILLAAL
jgi:uncharacterized membrane protein YfcA